MAALKALLPRLSGWAGETRVGARLKRLFPEVRHDLILPDGRGGLTQLDHLALTPAGLLVVETKTYSGIILGQANESTWTQVIGRRRHSFQNPLRQNYAHVRALEALVPDIPIEGQVVFAGSARFPEGLPEGVCRPSELADELRPLRQGEVSAALSRAWEKVLEASRTDPAARREHLRGLQARHGGVRSPRLPALLLSASFLWLAGLAIHHRPMIPWPGSSQAAVTHPNGFAAVLANLLPGTTPPPRPPVTVRSAPPPARHAPRRDRSGAVNSDDRAATIEWAAGRRPGSHDEDCALATAAMLIDNTAEQRRARDRACDSGSTR